MKKHNKRIKRYMKSVFSVHSVWKIIRIAVVLIFCIGYIDWKDIPSQKILGDDFAISAVIFVGILLLATLKYRHLEESVRIVAVNTLDLLLCVVNVFAAGYFAFAALLSIMKPYKMYLLCFLLGFTIIMMLIRKIRYEKADTKVNNDSGNIIDLKDLYEGKLGATDGMILLNEKEVDYDLLNRHSVINHLYNVLCNCKPQKQFVISLEGKWGVGKSTILKNVKRMLQTNQKNIIVIDSFDPWTYGTEESIVDNFFSCLLNSNDLKINSQEIRKSISVLSKAVIDSEGKREWLEKVILKERTVEESKSQINDYLRLCGKKIIIFIDNLDRINDEKKILFLFKLIGNVLNFDRVIFVVSYDPEVVKSVLDKHSSIGYSYLEKIIQMQICVPENDRDVLSKVVRVCTENLLKRYGLNEEQVNDYTEFIENICNSVKDIRDYKRIVNSVIVKVLNKNSYLANRDLLTIEYLKMKNFQLYRTIYENRKFFVSEGTMYDEELFIAAFNKERYAKDIKAFLQSLFEDAEYCKYQKMLAKIFPNINKYCENQKYYGVKPLTSEQIEKSRGIASAKYFPLYFSETENEFSILGGSMENYVKGISGNKERDVKDIVKLLDSFGPAMHREILEALQRYIPEIDKSVLYNLVIVLIEYYWDIDDSSLFWGLNARQRCSVVIWEILRTIDAVEFENVCQYLSAAYDKIGLINEILYWFEKQNDDNGRHAEWKNLENKIVSEILSKGIDLYSKQYYHHLNVWGMYRNLKEQEGVFINYIKRVCNRSTIFRILYDIMGHSIGTGHRYYFQGSTIKCFFEKDELNEYMQQVEPITEDEEFVRNVYEEYLKNPQEEGNSDNGILLPEERKLNLS